MLSMQLLLRKKEKIVSLIFKSPFMLLCLTLFQEYGVWAINMLNYHLTYTLFMFINSIIFNNFAIAIY